MVTLVIGASGLLGNYLKLSGDILCPTSKEFDITSCSSINSYFMDLPFHIETINKIVLLAAYTNVAKANNDKEKAYQVNVIGTRNILNAVNYFCTKARLTYISTDYVFRGDVGNYKVIDVTDPVPNNYYAYTKAVGEEIIKTKEDSIIIRTSFCRSDIWSYSKAFDDQYTSRDTVDIIAPMISKLINDNNPGIFHVGTERKSVYDLARRINSSVLPISRSSIKDVNIPFDTSLELTC